MPYLFKGLRNKIRALIVRSFHHVYYSADQYKAWRENYWLGTRTLKCPLDLWIYQEIIQDTQPDVIIESGTFQGGTTMFLASICELMGNGKIVSIDIQNREDRPIQERITYLTGSSLAPEIIDCIRTFISPTDSVMVVLDSDHHRDHVLAELELYSPFVSLDNYLIVEDTNINGHPVYPGFGPGPMEAVEAFLDATDDFVVDAGREKFYLTFNPHGYLRRIRR